MQILNYYGVNNEYLKLIFERVLTNVCSNTIQYCIVAVETENAFFLLRYLTIFSCVFGNLITLSL